MTRKTYLVSLILDEEVIDCGTTQNCRHALHGAYSCLVGIPNAEVSVRCEGRQVCWMVSDFYGGIREIEFDAEKRSSKATAVRRYDIRYTQNLNPRWKGWPKLAGTPHGTIDRAKSL